MSYDKNTYELDGAMAASAEEDERSNRVLQLAGWIVVLSVVLGFFLPAVGACTGTILAAWFIRTQKPVRGLLWMMAISFVIGVFANFRVNPFADPISAVKTLALLLVAALYTTLPFTLYRVISPRLPGWVATFTLPVAGGSILSITQPAHIDSGSSAFIARLLFLWFAAVVVWMWREEFGSLATGAAFFSAIGLCILIELSGTFMALRASRAFSWCCLALLIGLAIWSFEVANERRAWSHRPDAVARLRSPYTGNPLTVITEHGHEELVSTAGEHYAIKQGIPNFLRPEDFSGENGKYHHVYQTIGGFYDDIQRVYCALRGIQRRSYFLSYMRLLTVKSGDTVLETSVGTGLNLQYLPRLISLTGLDLSPEMLANCTENLRRWKLPADLILGNAEHMPFADSCFDVVFHVGGINFFTDRAAAIGEMIRVCKPGGHLLIADETEKHVKEVYEKIPGGQYRGRKKEVSAPIELIPPDMENIRLALLKQGNLYAITFSKPAVA